MAWPAGLILAHPIGQLLNNRWQNNTLPSPLRWTGGDGAISLLKNKEKEKEQKTKGKKGGPLK